MATLATYFPHFVFSSVVHGLGVTLDQELTFAPHIHSHSYVCYYRLRPLCTVARMVTPTTTATLVHSFRYLRLSCLNRFLHSSARFIGCIPKFDHISSYMCNTLCWFPARQRIKYRMAILVWHCLLGLAPACLVDISVAPH